MTRFPAGPALAQLLPALSKHGDVRTSFGRGAGEIPEGTESLTYLECPQEAATRPFIRVLSNRFGQRANVLNASIVT